MSDLGWMKNAACLGVVEPMWDDSTPTPEALRYCFDCPVIRRCAEYGLRRVEASDAGVLGGLGLYDRERIRNGQATLQQMWAKRMEQLMLADWDEALAEDFARTMPRLELV